MKLKITLHNTEYTLTPPSQAVLAAKAGYGNNSIGWQNAGYPAEQILNILEPHPAIPPIAVRFNGQIYPLEHYICSDGTIEPITPQDDVGYQICLNTAAFFVDKAIFDLFPSSQRYERIFNAEYVTLFYCQENLFSLADLSLIKNTALHNLASHTIPERCLLGAPQTIEYFAAHKQWYLRDLLIAQESDYPYPFRFDETYGEINAGLFCSPQIIRTLDISSESHYSSEQAITSLKIKVYL